MKEFYTRLLVRGYQSDLLIPAFTKGITGARAFIKRGSMQRCNSDQDKDTRGRVFFHLTYHPRDPTSKDLQRQFCQHLIHLPWEPPLWRLKNKPKFPLVSTRCVWLIAAQKYRKRIHVPQGRLSRRAPSFLIYGVEIGGPLFFIINYRERGGERYR